MKLKLALFSIILYITTGLYAIQPPDEDVSKARLLLSKYRWVQLHYFMQTGYSADFKSDETDHTFFLKHNRLIFNGQVAEDVYFLFQTDDFVPDSSEVNSTARYTRDAFINYKAVDAFQLYAGQMAVPFSRHNLISPATTLTMGINEDMLPVYAYTPQGRDIGLMCRGFVIDKHLEYRTGVYRGLARETVQYEEDGKTYTRNESGIPRLTTRVQAHFMEAEESFYYSENYLRKREVFTLGLGFDFQPGVSDKHKDNNFKNYFALAMDLSVNATVGSANALALDLGIVYSANNPNVASVHEGLSHTDNLILSAQAGFLLANILQPFGRITSENCLGAKDGGDYSFTTFSLGSNYFLDDHHAKTTIQFDLPIGDNSNRDGENRLVLQFQAYL